MDANDRLVQFLGYGSMEPRVVFLGTEESNGKGGATAIRIRRTEFGNTEDLRDACEKLSQDCMFENPFTRRGDGVQQWNAATKFRLALAGVDPSERSNCRCCLRGSTGWQHYWRTWLGRSDGDTFLTECFPVPRASARHWIPGYRPEAQWPARRDLLRAFAATTDPDYVVAYGAPAATRIGEILSVVPSCFGGTTSDWHQIATPSGRRASMGRTAVGTVVLRVGFFGQGQFSGGDIPSLTQAAWALGRGRVPLLHRASR